MTLIRVENEKLRLLLGAFILLGIIAVVAAYVFGASFVIGRSLHTWGVRAKHLPQTLLGLSFLLAMVIIVEVSELFYGGAKRLGDALFNRFVVPSSK